MADSAMDDPERRLADRGLTVEEYAGFDWDADPDSVGFVGVVRDSEGVYGVAYVAPNTEGPTRRRFAVWVEQKLDNYLECGPMRDGWQARESDGGWQLWAHAGDLEPKTGVAPIDAGATPVLPPL